jgi:hypothetical protein
MFKPTPRASAVLFWVFSLSASAQERQPATAAFTNVTVIPLDRAGHQSVPRGLRIAMP